MLFELNGRHVQISVNELVHENYETHEIMLIYYYHLHCNNDYLF